MKLCIVTVYDSINCGSFLQAYILKEKCEKMGFEVYFLKRSIVEKFLLNIHHYGKAIKNLFACGLKSYFEKRNIDREFKKMQKKFKTIRMKDVKNVDFVIIGSDTMWNINEKYFKRNYKLFFGGCFPGVHQITYAVSVGNTKMNEINRLKNINNYISNFDKISVRDDYTKFVVEEAKKCSPVVVCDPTLLFNKNEYKNIIYKRIEKEKYIYLYLFNDLSDIQKKNIKKFAMNNNLIIIDGTNDKKWANKSIYNTPELFLNYMFYADYIITDTFHGTIFSINFNKKFVVINRNKNKVNEFLEKCNLKNRLIDSQNLTDILIRKIDYKKVNNLLNDFRKKSVKFLNEALLK